MRKSTTKGRVPPVAVTPEQRYHMINDAAYFRTLKHRQEAGEAEAEGEAESWCEVEAEVDEVLKHHHAK